MEVFSKFSQLRCLLEGDEFGEECLSFVECHGYVTASVISPVASELQKLVWEIVGEDSNVPEAKVAELQQQLGELQSFIERELLGAESLTIPTTEEEEYVEELQAWSAAFMEKHLADEAHWFEKGGDKIAELLLPIVVASGLFDDTELEKIEQDDKLYLSMLENIPEVVIDLYGIFHESSKS